MDFRQAGEVRGGIMLSTFGEVAFRRVSGTRFFFFKFSDFQGLEGHLLFTCFSRQKKMPTKGTRNQPALAEPRGGSPTRSQARPGSTVKFNISHSSMPKGTVADILVCTHAYPCTGTREKKYGGADSKPTTLCAPHVQDHACSQKLNAVLLHCQIEQMVSKVGGCHRVGYKRDPGL